MADSGSPGWSTNEWAPSPAGDPYSIHDVTQGFGLEIATTTSNSNTSFFSCNGNGCSSTPTAGDSYQILRATVCMDQPGRGAGLLVQGGDCNTYPTSGHLCPQLVSTGAAGSVNEPLDPSYEVDDSVSGTIGAEYTSNDSQGEIANRDFYAQSIGQAAQTSATSPFNGTSGTGYGTLAYRPTTCTPSVGYLATDQGTWDQGGAGGVLYACTATNTWSVEETPYTYPHPLDSSGGSATGTTFSGGMMSGGTQH